jgi:hypothetical protein
MTKKDELNNVSEVEKLTNYVYNGAYTAATIAGEDYIFTAGKTYALPAQDEFVKSLARRGIIKEKK